MTFGDDSRPVNLHPDSEVTVGDSSSFRLTPLVKSASLRGKVIQLNLVRRSDGEHEYIQMREVPQDGRIVGGWRSVDDAAKDLVNRVITWAGAILVIVFVLGVTTFLAAFCVWALVGALRMMF